MATESMSGETERDVSGWTVDTVHSAMLSLLAEIDRRYDARFVAHDDALDAATRLNDSRFTAEEEARMGADKRYEQRFIAQEGAVQAALVAQEKAVNAALIAADRAVIKAESAAEKRFDAVNEFRGTLADQAAQLMPRAEAEARITAVSEKAESNAKNNADKISDLQHRVDENAGGDDRQSSLKGQQNWVLGIGVTLIVAMASMTVAILTRIH